MSFLASDQRIFTEDNLTPSRQQQQFMRTKKSIAKNGVQLSLSRDKSPKAKLYKELSQLVNIYTPLGVSNSKKRNNLVSNSFVNKRTITELEDKSQIKQENRQSSSINNNINNELIVMPGLYNRTPVNNKEPIKREQNQHRKVIISNNNPILINYEKHTDRLIDLPCLNPTPKGRESSQSRMLNNRRRENVVSMSPSNNPYSVQSGKASQQNNRLKTLGEDKVEKRRSILKIHNYEDDERDFNEQSRYIDSKLTNYSTLSQHNKFIFPQKKEKETINNCEIKNNNINQQQQDEKKKEYQSNGNSRAASPFNKIPIKRNLNAAINKNFIQKMEQLKIQKDLEKQNQQEQEKEKFQQVNQDKIKQNKIQSVHQSNDETIHSNNSPQNNNNQQQLQQNQQMQQQSNQQLQQQHQQIQQQILNNKTHPKQLYDMSEEEWNTFGDRFPYQFDKKKLLGRGGFALVWLGENKKTKETFAIKQILTNNAHQTHIKEIWFGSYFFEKGHPKEKFQNYKGINNFSKMMGYDIKPQDTWIFYELCGESLGNCLYELKGEGMYQGERIYRIHYKMLYHSIRKDLKLLKRIIIDIAEALLVLSDNRIVHSDVKTENILIKTKKVKQDECQIQDVKLIDYGSSFTFGNLKHFSMATPEYMAPEILNFILYQNQLRHLPKMLNFIKNYEKPYVIDVWSLGCVILEVISGLPLWMSLKTIVQHKGQEVIRNGLFAAKGRVFESIIEKQIEVVKNIDKYLDEENYSGIVIDNEIRTVLKKMLCLEPDKRFSPREIINFLQPEALAPIQKIQTTSDSFQQNTVSTLTANTQNTNQTLNASKLINNNNNN